MAITNPALAEEAPSHEATTEGVSAHPGKEAGTTDFPPFDPANFAPQLIWLALIFGFLYVLMARVALPRVASILSEREQKIGGDLDSARELQTKARAVAAQNDETLRATKARAQAIGREAQERAATEAQARRAALDREFSAEFDAAFARIASAKERAMANIDQIARDAAGSIVEKLTGKPADPAALEAASRTLHS